MEAQSGRFAGQLTPEGMGEALINLFGQFSTLETDLRQKQIEKDQLESQISGLHGEHDARAAELARLTAELQSKEERLQAVLGALRQANHSLEGRQAEFQLLNSALEAKEAELGKLAGRLREMREQRERQISKWKADLEGGRGAQGQRAEPQAQAQAQGAAAAPCFRAVPAAGH